MVADFVKSAGDNFNNTGNSSSSSHGQYHVIIQSSIGCGTILIFGAIRLLVYLILRCRLRMRSVQPEEDPDCPMARREIEEQARKEHHILSELPGDLLMYPVVTAVGFCTLHSPAFGGLNDSPFTTYSATCGYVFAAVLGCLVFKLTSLALLPIHRRFKMDIIHYLAAIVIYTILLIEKEDGVLGAVGMITFAPLLFLTLRRGTEIVDRLTVLYPVVSVTWVVTSPLFMLILPAGYLIHSIVQHRVEVMSYLSAANLCFACAYFSVAFFVHVIRAIMKVFCPVETTLLQEGTFLLRHCNKHAEVGRETTQWTRDNIREFNKDSSLLEPFSKEQHKPRLEIDFKRDENTRPAANGLV